MRQAQLLLTHAFQSFQQKCPLEVGEQVLEQQSNSWGALAQGLLTSRCVYFGVLLNLCARLAIDGPRARAQQKGTLNLAFWQSCQQSIHWCAGDNLDMLLA